MPEWLSAVGGDGLPVRGGVAGSVDGLRTFTLVMRKRVLVGQGSETRWRGSAYTLGEG